MILPCLEFEDGVDKVKNVYKKQMAQCLGNTDRGDLFFSAGRTVLFFFFWISGLLRI